MIGCQGCTAILADKTTRTVLCPDCGKLIGVRAEVIEPDDDLSWKGPK